MSCGRPWGDKVGGRRQIQVGGPGLHIYSSNMPRQASKAKERVCPGPLGKGYDGHKLMSGDFSRVGTNRRTSRHGRTCTKRARCRRGQFRACCRLNAWKTSQAARQNCSGQWLRDLAGGWCLGLSTRQFSTETACRNEAIPELRGGETRMCGKEFRLRVSQRGRGKST